MIYKVVMMSGKEIILENEDALMKLLDMANRGSRLVLTKHGVINPASIDSIVPHKEMNESLSSLLQLRTEKDGRLVPQYNVAEAEKKVLPPSPFSKLLGEKMQMLSPQDRTSAIEEADKRK